MNNKRLEAILKQYEIIFSYSTKAIPNSKNSILTFGLSAIGTILLSTIYMLNVGKHIELCIISFIFIIPLACFSLLFIWAGEIHRMLRAGNYVKNLEAILNNELNEYLFNWENYIREKEHKIVYPEIFVISIFIGTAITSIISGIWILNNDPNTLALSNKQVFFFAGIIFSSAIGLIFHLLNKFNKYR
ncbi:MAG: hypothetical protein HGB09_00245 [Chlorobiaceae bacterium]|nr:hypothetical protein [Chlorobiaceae bacterium]